MLLNQIKNSQDVLKYLKKPINYGWLAIYGNKHYTDSIKDFLSKTLSISKHLIIRFVVVFLSLMIYENNKVYQLEYPNTSKKVTYEV